MVYKQNCVVWIHTMLYTMDENIVYRYYCIKKKQMILTRILQNMLKKDLVLQNDELKCNSFKRSFELTDVSYSVSGIQDYFKYIFKKMKQWLIILQ